MKLILKYIKPFALIVVVCLLLLFFQAVCDLSLPNMMSDIVNTGIQKSGVEDGAPEVMSPDAMTFIKTFMSTEDQKAFESAYSFVEGGSEAASAYQKQYPKTESEGFYALVKDAEKQEAASSAYNASTYAFVLLLQDMAEENSSGGSVAYDEESGLSDVTAEQIYEMLPMLTMLPEGMLDEYIETSQNVDSTISGQIATTFSGLFYKELGANLREMQRVYIRNTGFKMLGLALLVTIASVLVGFFASRVAASVSRKLRRDIFDRVMHFSNSEIDKFSTASLITRTTNDVSQVQMLIIIGIRMLCYAPIMGIGGIIMAVQKSASLSWIIALAVLVVIGLIAIVFVVAMPKFKLQQKLIDKLNLVSRENLSGIMVIRAFGNEKHEEARFDDVNEELTRTNRFVQRVMAIMMPTMMLVMNLLTIVITWVGSNAIAASTMQIGDMIAFIQYAMQIIMSFLMIAVMFIMVPRASVSATRISEVLDTPLKIKDPAQPKKLENVKGVIEFKDVAFRYDNAEQDVLENISFTANPGKTTAFIGATGSGKTTLVNLIPRFYDVTGGSIKLDGVDLREVTQHDLRDQIGYISQKGILFSGDIASNVRYGKEDASDLEVEESLRVAQASDFVAERDGGIHAPISQGGTNVSGGQKQRLSIARALVKKAPIYIFDDTFSALDFKTDAALRKALAEQTGDSTVLIVAQRVSTIMHAEQIIVLDMGRIVGIGTHTELLKNCKEYREIAESQLSEEELA